MIYIDVDTAVTVPVNIMPLTDDTDFITRETGITYNQAGMDLVWNFVTSSGTITQTAVTPTTAGVYDWTHIGDAMYKIEIPASGGGSINNDTEGVGYFTGICTGVLAWRGPDIVFRDSGINDVLIDSAYSATRGLAGTALPAAAADAAGGLIISDAGGLDIDSRVISATATGNLEDMYDGTGYSADTAPATQAQIGGIANVGSAVHKSPSSYTLTTGTQSSGTVSDVEALNDVFHEHTDDAGVLLIEYHHLIGGGTPSSVQITGFVNGSNDTVLVAGYDWVVGAYVQIGKIEGVNGTPDPVPVYSFDLFVDMVGSGADEGKVDIKIYATSGLSSSTTKVDQIFVAFSQGVEGYDNGAVWFNSNASNTNTEVNIDGTARNPVSSSAALLTLLASTGLKKIEVAPGSTLTLGAAYEGYDVNGNGAVLALNSQNIGGSIFSRFSSVTGVGTTSANPCFFEDCIFGTATVPPSTHQQCGYGATLTQSGTGDYTFVDCYSTVAGTGSPTFTISAAGVATVEFRRFSGGITQSGIQGGDIATIGGELGTVTLNGADGTVDLRGTYKEVTDSRTGSPTLNLDGAIKAADIALVLGDTAELQTDWTDGGRLDLLLDATSTHSAADVWTASGRALSDPCGFKKNTAVSNFTFLMVDSTDHITPIAGETVTAERSIDGAAFGACTNAVAEVEEGMYKIDFSAADTNGDIVSFKFTSSGADPRFITIMTET